MIQISTLLIYYLSTHTKTTKKLNREFILEAKKYITIINYAAYTIYASEQQIWQFVWYTTLD